MGRQYEIDGNDFSTLEEFYEEISCVLIPGAPWGRGDLLWGIHQLLGKMCPTMYVLRRHA